MSDERFYCWKCSRRLPVDEVDGRVTAICRHCKEKTAIDSRSTFRSEVKLKRA